MKLNKVVSGVSVIALSAVLLSACSSTSSSKNSTTSKSSSSKVVKKASAQKQVAGGALKDGTYKLEETGYYNGYKGLVSMTVKGGKITNTTFDYINKDGKSKTKDANYEKQMKSKAGTGPKEYIPQLNKSFQQNGADTNKIEVVSGATGTSLSFKNYAQQLVQAAQKGDTNTIKVDNMAKLKDGTYTLEEKNYSHDYRVTMSLTVKDGKISDVKYDNVNKNGESKTKNAEYEKTMKSKVKVGPAEYIPKLQQELKKSDGDLEKVQVVSGATESSNTFLLYAAQLLNAAQKGNTNKIEVDNIVYAD